MCYNNRIINLAADTQSIKLFTRKVSSLIAGYLLFTSMLKRCYKCRLTLDEKLFHKDITTKDRLSGLCKECTKSKGRLYRLSHKELLTSRRKKDYLLNKSAYHDKNVLESKRLKELRKTHIDVFSKFLYSYMYRRVKGYVKHSQYYVGLVLCNRDDFLSFCKHNSNLKHLFNVWVFSGYQPRLAPTVDRIINEKGYSLDNIQFLPKFLNSKKRWEDGKFLKYKSFRNSNKEAKNACLLEKTK